MNSKKYSKKIQDVFLDDPYKILSFMRWGVTTPANLRYELGIESKQNLNHYLKKYVQEGLLQKLGKGMYVMTESGKRMYDHYEHYKNKQLVRVENAKVTFVDRKSVV